MKNIVLGIALLTITGGVCATEITSTTKVGEIWSGYSDGRILFGTSLAHINPAGCANTSFYAVDASKADADKFLSMLLTAQSRDADVQIRISKTLCFSGYPVALRMAIKP